jgi:GNAT superfamily N-acetyltransferase
MGKLPTDQEQALECATTSYLREALPAGEYLAWVAQPDAAAAEPIGGAGVQLRTIVPRPRSDGSGIELGPDAIVLSVYVEPRWRRQGAGEALMGAVLDALRARRISRIVLHASDDGRRMYERLGFVPTNEMLLTESRR